MTPVVIDYRLTAPLPLHACFEVRGFTVLLGGSGVGKTSLLRALAGLLPAHGTPWASLPANARPIGYLPQETMLFPHLSVLENTAYALRGTARLARARALLAGLGLEALAARRPYQLSGGQAKRVALARALARGAALLLLDEPSAGLDTLTRDATLSWLIEMTAARGIPVLAATHDHDIAARADHVALLVEGEILQQGPARAVFSAPVNRAAAQLLGYETIFNRQGECWAVRAASITEREDGEVFSVHSAREIGTGLRLVCGPALSGPEASLVVHLPTGGVDDYPPGRLVRLDLSAAIRVADHDSPFGQPPG